MNLVIENERVAVYDDVLAPNEIKALRDLLGREQYTTPAGAGSNSKAWRPSDGEPLCSKAYRMLEAPFGTALDHLIGPAQEAAARHPKLIQSYDDISLRTYMYPRGTRLSWHNDACAGALTFFAHRRWGATWGGQAFIADSPPLDQYQGDKSGERAWPLPDWEDDYVGAPGVGLWIMPKPNRLVLTARTAFHSVNRVDDDAGAHVRISITGFYVRKPPQK